MNAISLHQAYLIYVLAGTTPGNKIYSRDEFFDLLINNEIHATGFKAGSLAKEIISTNLWDILKTSDSISKPIREYEACFASSSIFGSHEEGVIYKNVMIHEYPYMGTSPSAGGTGRKANTSAWYRTVAEICCIIHFEGFTKGQTDFVRKIENSVRLRNDGDPLGRGNLEKLVQHIYRRCVE